MLAEPLSIEAKYWMGDRFVGRGHFWKCLAEGEPFCKL